MMKRCFALLFSLLMLFPLAACSSELAVTETAAETVTDPAGETEEEKETGEIVYPEGFSAGFGRRDITPEMPMEVGDNQYAKTVQDPLYATCTALCDGENVALLFHLDMKSIPTQFLDTCLKRFERKFGIPHDNVILNATHSHNSPVSITGSGPEVTRWLQKVLPAMDEAVETALRDLAPAEIYTAKGDTTGFAFVRRYLMANGQYRSVQTGNPCEEYVSHESEADPELRTIRFDRGDKKDILLVNWQAHAAHGRSENSSVYSSDFIYELRQGVEKEMDVHFAYHNGASGNLNFTDKLGKQKYATYHEVGKALVDVVKETVKTEKKAESGPIRATSSMLKLKGIQETPERIEGAKAYRAASSDTQKQEILAKYGFVTSYEVAAILTRASRGEEVEVPMFAIACGDLAFASVPFEQFDSDGKAIRESSPYDMTFICAYSNGHYGYLPSSLAFPHGEYEVYVTGFVEGSSDQVVAESIRLLQETAK